jgi:hypothetical protein
MPKMWLLFSTCNAQGWCTHSSQKIIPLSQAANMFWLQCQMSKMWLVLRMKLLKLEPDIIIDYEIKEIVVLAAQFEA